MKLLRYGPLGAERPAVLADQDEIAIDVGDEFHDFDQQFFASRGLTRLSQLLEENLDELPRIDPRTVRIGAPIAKPYQVLCIGLNYADHAAESGMEIPKEPILFNKAPGTVVGPFDDVLLPRGSSRSDWEVELAVVIGSEARYLPDHASALDCIAGYAVSNDVSEREWQLERGGQWVKGKSCETFNPLGPWLVTPDEVADPGSLELRLDLNGETMQAGSTTTMIFHIPEIIRYLSQFMVLEPGDLINTGTPPGVGLGQVPPRYLQDGDEMVLSIAGLGEQRQHVRRVDAPDGASAPRSATS